MSYKSPDSDLRKYFQSMATAIGTVVYDRVPDNAAYPYIHLSDLNGSDQSTSTESLYSVEALFDCVTSFDGDFGGRKQCDTIGNAIMNYLTNNYATLTDFKIVSAELANYNYIDEFNETSNIHRKLIRIELKLEQLN